MNIAHNIYSTAAENLKFEQWGSPLVQGEKYKDFLISNFRRALYVLCFLLGNSPASEFYMPTFRNTLNVPPS